MKKLKILIFLSTLILCIGIVSIVYARNDVKHVLTIDTKLDNAIFDKNGIHIDGWKLSTESNTKIIVDIDGQEMSDSYIKYSYKYDLISIVKGYGTYKENPLPMYDIDIPTTNISDGKHNIKIKFVLSDGTILDSVEKNIIIQKVKHVLTIDTKLDNAIFDKNGIHIDGWKLSTEPNTKIVVEIDGQEMSDSYIKYSYKYDLISIVKEYGTYKENPLPMYDIDIPTTNISDGKHNIKIKFVLSDGTILDSVEKNIIIQKVKHVLTIDTKLDNAIFDKNGIHVDGWKLSTEPNTKIVVEIDGQKMSDSYIKYSYKYDLISIVKGYGTYKENPLPMYDIDIPTTNINAGKHNIKIKFVLSDGTILDSVEKSITIDKSIKSVLNIDTNIDSLIFNETKNIKISGWKLATEPNTKIVIYIDGQKVDSKYITYSYKYDLISIVKGYGTYKENPLPMYDINIPTANISKQNHKMKLQFIAKDGVTVLDSKEFTAIYGDRYKGIDVSSHNGNIDWKQVASQDIDFAIIRIGYRGYRNPVIVLDTNAIYNIKEAKAAGLKVGVYFVTQAINIDEAREEALWVVSQIHQNNIKLDYPIAIDTEDSGATQQGNPPGRADLLDVATRTMLCRAFADVIKYYEFTPAIYANSDWFNNKLNLSELKIYDIWLAQYTNNENKLPNFSEEFQIWQYTDAGKILGVGSNYVDINICYKKY